MELLNSSKINLLITGAYIIFDTFQLHHWDNVKW